MTKMDVLAVLNRAVDLLDENECDEVADLVWVARGAVAELVESDREFDAALDSYGTDAKSFYLGGRQFVCADDPVVLRLDDARNRRAAALERIGGPV